MASAFITQSAQSSASCGVDVKNVDDFVINFVSFVRAVVVVVVVVVKTVAKCGEVEINKSLRNHGASLSQLPSPSMA